MRNKKPFLTFSKFSKFEEFINNLDVYEKAQLTRVKNAVLWNQIKEFYLEKQSSYLLLIVPNAGVFEFEYSDSYFSDLWNYFKRLEKKGVL